MFDRRIEKHSHYYGGGNTNVNVTEHRAPTDESIRLAEEYREKALQSIIHNEYVRNNNLEFRVMIADRMPSDGCYGLDCYIVAIINNKRYEIRKDITHMLERKIVKRQTLNGEVTEFEFNEQQFGIIKMNMLVGLLLQAMFDTSSEDMDRLAESLKIYTNYWERPY